MKQLGTVIKFKPRDSSHIELKDLVGIQMDKSGRVIVKKSVIIDNTLAEMTVLGT